MSVLGSQAPPHRAARILATAKTVEIGSTLIGWIAMPEQLTSHLEVQANHVSLYERPVRFECADRFGWDVLHTGQEVALVKCGQRHGHRRIDHRRGHDGLNRVLWLPADGGSRYLPQHRCRN